MEPPKNPLHPKVRTLWRIGAAIPGGGWALGWLIAAAFVPVLIVIALLPLPLVFIVPDAMFRRWRYEIRERDVYLSRGVVFSSVAVIPFDRIQFVETRQGPLDRFLSLAQIVIYTAGGRESIPGIALDQAERLREELAKVAGTTSV